MPGVFMEQDGACIYATEKCNSNCVMCPISVHARQRGASMHDREWHDGLDAITDDVMHITVTGGEPFLEYKRLIPLLKQINERFADAEILLLTNGRALSLDCVFREIRNVITEKYCFAIPIHGSTPELHDMITQSPGSFEQAMRGIHNLSATYARTEIRIVGHRKNIHDIRNIFGMLAKRKERIDVINLVAMEMTGSAAAARKDLWVDYQDLCLKAEDGIRIAMEAGIDVGLYNFPLCCVPERMWGLVKKSISPGKVRYYAICDQCSVKDACGGLFYSTYELGLCKVTPM